MVSLICTDTMDNLRNKWHVLSITQSMHQLLQASWCTHTQLICTLGWCSSDGRVINVMRISECYGVCHNVWFGLSNKSGYW